MMDYKRLFNRTLQILSNPSKAWEEIGAQEEVSEEVQGSFVYPMIGFCGLAAFVGLLFGNGVEEFNLQVAMTKCCGVFVSLFGGYFLAVWLASRYGGSFPGTPAGDRNYCATLVGYSMVVLFVLEILFGLFTSFFILRWILQFYLVYVVWEGAKTLMRIPEERLLTYTIVTSAIILASPFVLDKVFGWLSGMVN